MLTVALCGLSFSASAQAPKCVDREEYVTGLKERYGETKQSQGLTDSGDVIETFRNNNTGTWTIVMSNANGLTCPIVSGQHWIFDPQKAPSL